jgi:hypothetical protein
MMSKELHFAFAGVLALPHVAWLYELRSSEVFFQLWRSVGQEVSIAFEYAFEAQTWF